MRPLSVLLLLSFLFPAPSPSQQLVATTATPPAQSSQGIASLQSSLGLLTGLSGAAPSSLIASGTYVRLPDSNQPENYTISIKTLGLQSFRSDVIGPQGATTVIVNGTSGWMQDSTGGRALAIGETFGRGSEIFPILLISRWLGTPAIGVADPVQDTVNSTEVVRISITPQQVTLAGSASLAGSNRLAKCDLYVDPRTNLPIRIRVYKQPSDHRVEVPMDLDFSDFRSVGGAQYPFTITYSAGGQTIARLQLQTISLNVAVSASDFVGGAQ